jgi:DNA-binding transcriptional LysR family regulator
VESLMDIREPADILGKVLIRSESKQVGWDMWCERNAIPAPLHYGMRFDRSFLAISAAADGLGIALESKRLAERELANGRLVAPLSVRARNVEYIGHRLVYPKARSRHVLETFARWLAAELALEPESWKGAGY